MRPSLLVPPLVLALSAPPAALAGALTHDEAARRDGLAAAAARADAALRTGQRPELNPAERVPALRALLAEGGAETDAETPRVFGGNDAARGAWPFQVALLQSWRLDARAESQLYAQFCGGSVIAPDLILTAAHCIDQDGETFPPEAVIVLTGATDLAEGTRHAVAEIVKHPGYDPIRLDNDIAILRLAVPTSAPAIRLARETPEDGPVWVTGWGMTEDESFPAWLQEVKVGLQPSAACNGGIKMVYREDLMGMLGSAALRMGFSRSAVEAAVDLVAAGFADPLTPGMLCAGIDEGRRDACYGDSGGPLFALTPEGPVQHGVVSWGEGPRDGSAACGHAGLYGVYARVSHYRDWIAAAGGPR